MRPAARARAVALLVAVVMAATACDPTGGQPPGATSPPGFTTRPEVTARPEATSRPEATTRPEATSPPETTSPPEVTLPGLDRPPGRASGGVTEEPCPVPVNPANGCLYLGVLEDLGRGPLGRVGTASTAARGAFWKRINEAGGIGTYDVDASTFVRDTGGDPQAHVDAFASIASDVLAVAASRGTGATWALQPLLRQTGMAALTTAAVSGWATSTHVFTSGATACAAAAGGADHVLREGPGAVAVVVHPGAFGDDAAAGAALAAAHHGVPLTVHEVPDGDGPPALEGTVAAVLEAAPAVVVVAAGARVLEALAAGLAASGYDGTVTALAAAWDERLAARLPARAAERLLVVGPWAPWASATQGHAALRAALGEARTGAGPAGQADPPSEAHVAGWASQYPLAAALRAAEAAGELTPDGVRRALAGLDGFPSDGMLPPGGADGATAGARSVISRVDADAPTGLVALTATSRVLPPGSRRCVEG